MDMVILVLLGLWTAAAAGAVLLGLLLLGQIYLLMIRRRWVRSLALPSLTAYTPSPSYTVGAQVPVHVHSTRPATATLLRLGEQAKTTGTPRTVAVTLQSARYDYWRGLDWPATFTIDTRELQPGMYHLQLEHADDRAVRYSVTFLLAPATTPAVAVIIATNTWQAYNDFGGLSNYNDRVTPFPLSLFAKLFKVMHCHLHVGERHYLPSVPLPESRPNDTLDADFRQLNTPPAELPSHIGRGDWALVRFLEREQIPYGLFSERDLVFDPRPTASRLIIYGAHSEYWSTEMMAAHAGYLERGGRVVFVSGNNLYGKVILLGRAVQAIGLTSPDDIARLTGLVYDARGYLTFAGFRMCAPDHWACAGLDVKAGDVFAAGADNRGASGYETDKPHPNGGACTILATGCNAEGPAFIICREHAGGGWVLNLGSVASAAWVGHDRVLGGIVRNAIQRALQG